MAKIQQLSPHVADLIAAGEVVERPASAAKELVENAIDAGAKTITVELQNGGMTFLRVTDDGCGMAPEEAATAFLRHATSKLRTAEDLVAISTLGFRGEALAAISAVSRIDLLTKTPERTFGVSLHLEAGVVTDQEEAGCPNGTTIIVRDLFYNTPARMKFMKRDTVEASALVGAVERLALAHPEVSFRAVKDGEEVLRTPGDGQLSNAISAVLGRQLARDMVEVRSRWEKYSLTGYVTKPTATRGNRSNQLFFVNGRHVRSKTMTAALEEAYRNQLMVGRFPSCVLHLQLPEHLVDVNVHPAKIEVKFINERELFDCIRYGVQGALEKAPARPAMELPQQKAAPRQEFFRTMSAADYKAFQTVLRDAAPAIRPAQPAAPAARPAPVTRPVEKIVEKPAESPAASRPAPAVRPKAPVEVEAPAVCAPAAPVREISSLVPQPSAPQAERDAVQQELPLPTRDWRIVGEVFQTYIIVEQGDRVIFMDKHAAHERILFEKLRRQPENVTGQLLLAPILCEPAREEAALLLENQELLRQCGFEVSDYGGGTLAIRQIPADLDPAEAEATINAIASDLRTGRGVDLSDRRDRLLHTVACKAAIKGGWHTEGPELRALVAEVLSREDLKYCPHGRPICVEMTSAQFEKQFKRT